MEESVALVACCKIKNYSVLFNVEYTKYTKELPLSIRKFSDVFCPLYWSKGRRYKPLWRPPRLTGYLSKVLRNYTEQACEGDFLSVRCPPRTTITVQSAFYGRRGASDAQQCPQTYKALLSSYNAREDDRYCSVSTALQVNNGAHWFLTVLHQKIQVAILYYSFLNRVHVSVGLIPSVSQTWISSHSSLS